LIIDADPQGNASTGFGIKYNERDKDLYSVMCGNTNILNSIRNTMIPKLDIIPTSPNLSVLEQELVNIENREFIIQKLMENIKDLYDYIIIDCPPSLGLLTVNALCAVKNLIIPLQTEFYALEGLTQLIKTLDLVQHNFNQDIKLQGILLTMYDTRNKISEMVSNDVKKHFGDKVFKTIIPRNVRVSEAPSFGQPVLMYDINCPGSQAYAALAGEIINQEKVL
jgi:chromosome partitioning protein